MALYPLPGVADPAAVADVLVGHRAPRELPAGEVVLAELKSDASRLEAIPPELRKRRRDVQPCLVAIHQTENPNAVEEGAAVSNGGDDETETAIALAQDLADVYAKVVLVSEDNRELVRDLVPFLAALSDQSAGSVTGIGTARFITVDVSDCPPDPGVLVPDLRARKGKPLHPIDDDPELFAFTAPEGYVDIVQSAFEPLGTIIGRGTVSHDRITVVGFSFRGAATTTTNGETTAPDPGDWAPELPRSPVERTGEKMDPLVVRIDRSVLDEVAAHAVATPDIEVYGALYADAHECISHYHPIESELHVRRTESSVDYTEQFAEHMRTLASLYDGIGCRLAGDCHSHPSGSIRQSRRDKRTARNIWRSDRNTCLVVGIVDGSGPDQWKLVDGEARKGVGDYLVRIAAYSGTTEEKTIRIVKLDQSLTEERSPESSEIGASRTSASAPDHAFAPVQTNRRENP